ncbi:stealth conserved region 3 domain-containing protein [Ilumatobacter sp.]|uniref:stealth family protein n=1 Tax=Ilumatobacter sp. TaxID=1967498 RepID=UPI003B52AD6F
MASRLHRLRGLVERYRMDRRLPPVVADLMSDVARLRRDEALEARTAASRSVLRPSTSDGPALATGRDGRRLLETAGVLDVACSELVHRCATRVVEALDVAGCEPFLVERRDDGGLVVGVRHDLREDALDAVAAVGTGPGWFLEWAGGRRSGLVALADAPASRPVRRARSWRIFEARTWGERAIGARQAVEVGFWHPGTSGQLELVGTRGQARFDERAEPTTEVLDGHRYPGRSAFPVAAGLERMSDPVDLVFTWVDGGDPTWQESFREAALSEGRALDERALDAARYEVRDELRYALRSVWANCGWARRIHLVTAGQVPDWFVGDERVRIVDHSEIFPPEALPTFNSHSIEASLHRIDDLAEHFVYLNDDMFVARAVTPELFFTPNGLARVFQSDARVPAVEDPDTLAVDTAALRGRELLRRRFGRIVAHKPLHSPYPLRRSAIGDAEREFPDEFAATVRSRFRSPSDLSVAASFAQHHCLATGRAVLGELSSEYVHVESGRLAWHLDRILLDDELDTFCLNATRAGLAGQEERDAMIARFLEERFPVPSPWERT